MDSSRIPSSVRVLGILWALLAFACTLQVGSEAGVMVDTSGESGTPSALAQRVIDRLEAGQLETVLRRLVPDLSDEEIASVRLKQDYHSDDSGNSGTMVTCWIDADDHHATEAINGCITAIQKALSAELAEMRGAPAPG